MDTHVTNHLTPDSPDRQAYQDRLRHAIDALPGWAQILLIDNGKHNALDIEIGEFDDFHEPKMTKTARGDCSHKRMRLRTDYFPTHREEHISTNNKGREIRKVIVHKAPNEELPYCKAPAGDYFMTVFAHEMGHRIDRQLRTHSRSAKGKIGAHKSQYFSDHNNDWSHRTQQDLTLYQYVDRPIDLPIDQYKDLFEHLKTERLDRETPPYTRKQFACEAFAKMSEFYLALYRQFKENGLKVTEIENEIDILLNDAYPNLYPAYRDTMIPMAMRVAGDIARKHGINERSSPLSIAVSQPVQVSALVDNTKAEQLEHQRTATLASEAVHR